MISWLCILPGLVLVLAGFAVGVMSRPKSYQGLGALGAAALGALGVDAGIHDYGSVLLAAALVALCVAALWLVLGRHQSPALQRWSVTDRGGLE